MRIATKAAIIAVGFIAVGTAVALGLRCPGDPFPRVVDPTQLRDWKRDTLLQQYGTPYERVIGSSKAVLLSRDHSYQVVELIEKTQAEQQVELIVWRRYCRSNLIAEMAGAFNPTTGALLQRDGQPLLLIRREVSR